jgi:hypothetical protein
MNLALNNSKKAFFVILYLSFIQISCVKLLDIEAPIYISQNVLIGVLHPDSCIKVRVFKTLPSSFKDNNYTGIDSLKVIVFEDKKEQFTLKNVGNGYYEIPIKPKSGHLYSVEAKIDEGNIISAQDSIPVLEVPLITLTQPKPENFNSNPDLVITKNINNKSIWWFSLNFIKKGISTPQTLLSNSQNLDIFNSKVNNIDGRRDFYLITRVLPEMPLGKEINIGFVNAIKDVDAAFIYFSCVSPTYDKYLKTAIEAYQNSLVDNSGNVKNPFGNFLPVYSNVKNGLGIFIAYNTKKVQIK